MKKTIIFLKSLNPESLSTENFARKVYNDPKYDNNPLIDKKAIEEAFEKYDKKLNPLNDKIFNSLIDFSVNVEGHFLAQNIPEITSIVIDKTCTKKVLYNMLDKYDDITHIGLSTYADGLDNTIEIIKIIQSEFQDKKLYIGGVGTVYPHLQNLVEQKNICTSNGVNWLRKKFELKQLLPKDFQIPKIIGTLYGFSIPVKAAYMVSQIGCLYNCDFCITNSYLKYNPFARPDKIINYIEELCSGSNRDIFLYVCDPNAFYPELTWRKVFEYFIKNPKNIDNNVFIQFLGSLSHINKFNLETIQNRSPLKFAYINYGIESTLRGGYLKNKGQPKKVIERLNNIGITTIHTYIIGFPFHTRKTINLEIKNNCKFDSDLIMVNVYKPIPKTPLYNQLKSENRINWENLPSEFLCSTGFLAFNHKYLGVGFSILKYAFKAYYEIEKKVIDVFSNFANKLLDMFAITNSRKIKRAAKIFLAMSELNLNHFQSRMPNNLVDTYKGRLENTKLRFAKI